MATCKMCGKRGLFLRLGSHKACRDCELALLGVPDRVRLINESIDIVSQTSNLETAFSRIQFEKMQVDEIEQIAAERSDPLLLLGYDTSLPEMSEHINCIHNDMSDLIDALFCMIKSELEINGPMPLKDIAQFFQDHPEYWIEKYDISKSIKSLLENRGSHYGILRNKIKNKYYYYLINQEDNSESWVVTFEERKKTAIPSNRGLYPAEILLLYYCSKGKYPYTENEYPGFWWYSYGIRDVNAMLKTLEERGFIVFASSYNFTVQHNCTVQQLKELLAAQGQPTTGRKAELVARVSETVPEDFLIAAGVQLKYGLTEVGRQELEENAYVPYMHRAPNKTVDDDDSEFAFNVWYINKLLGTGDKSNWETVVKEQDAKVKKDADDRHEAFMNDLKESDPEGYRKLKAQDEQLALVQKAQADYWESKDLEAYISFWEAIWENGGLLFEGAGWHFVLPDLYIKAKRYDDALAFVVKLKKIKPIYAYKSDAYIKKIGILEGKQIARNNKNTRK